MEDATFEDGAFAVRPLRIAVETAEDLQVASALIQDAVGLVREISWMPRRRRLVLLVNRLRRENESAPGPQGKNVERVRCALVFDSVLGVKGRGIDPRDPETVFSLLAIGFKPGEDAGGEVLLQLAGDGDLALKAECIDMRLIDLTRPWQAGAEPDHQLD